MTGAGKRCLAQVGGYFSHTRFCASDVYFRQDYVRCGPSDWPVRTWPWFFRFPNNGDLAEEYVQWKVALTVNISESSCLLDQLKRLFVAELVFCNER